MAAGEALELVQVKETKDSATAAGVVNPRKTGGGRARRTVPAQAVLESTPSPQAVLERPPTFAAGVRALADEVQAKNLQAYIDQKQAQDPRYRILDDEYVRGYVAALEDLRRVIGP